jgi:hypothetical protein
LLYNFRFEIEHINPSAAGGLNSEENLALSCRSCNLYKSNRTQWTDPESGEVVRLFNPRLDEWRNHFSIDANLAISGVSAIGRATVAAMNLNSPEQLSPRPRWRRLKLFP